MTSGSEICSWKHSKPSSLLVQEYPAALMRVTLGGFCGFTGGTGLEDLGQSPEVSGVVLTMEVSQWRLSSWIHAGCWKKMLPNTQSIKGLQWVSQQYPSTIMQLWSNIVM